ncbi:polycystin-1 isoform X6 [Zootoca vivipara]|uniref:polycystin-1 isoform X6 n=1 Tax=Zootoca vivipara TaxID=8524 RepID=UPI00293BA140|nr:polycystin-1 isoform X6 [Zootoca vivipara]
MGLHCFTTLNKLWPSKETVASRLPDHRAIFCHSSALLCGALLLCSLCTGEMSTFPGDGAAPSAPGETGAKAKLPKQWSSAKCKVVDPWKGQSQGLREKERHQVSEGLGGMKRVTLLIRARCQQEKEEALAVLCPAMCACTFTAVNCSHLGLLEIPTEDPCSLNKTILDLSHNRLSIVRREELAGYPNIQALDLSFNCIHTIEEGAFHYLGKLRTLNLISNSVTFDCSLRWLMTWAQERHVLVSNTELLRCVPAATAGSVKPLDLLSLTHAVDFISCVKDTLTRSDAVLHYSYLSTGTHTQKSCLELCYSKGYTYYAMDFLDRCLCGSLGSEVAVDCGKVCSNEIQSQACNKTVIHAAYPIQVKLSFTTRQHHGQLVEFAANISLPGTLYIWDFGDGGDGGLNTTNPRVLHAYLPGTYMVMVEALTAGKSLFHRATIHVVLPVKAVILKCPKVVVRHQNNIDIWIHAQEGTDLSVIWRMKDPGGQELLGGQINLQNLNCYWLGETKETWQDARKLCQGVPGGDLVVVRSLEVQSYLQKSFSNSAGTVWIGLRDLGSSGSMRWVDGGLVDTFQNWMSSGRPEGGKEMCVKMLLVDSRGNWRCNPCSEKSPFICEKTIGDALPNPNFFLTGMPRFSAIYEVKNVSTRKAAPFLGGSKVELMLFPGLWFSHNGTVASLDFAMQATNQPIQARFQIFRPYCSPSQHLIPPGCKRLHSPFACCHSEPLCNAMGECPSGQQWCPLKDHCLNISSPCSPYAFENTTAHIQPFPYPLRYKGASPFYSIVADLPLLLTPSNENTHIHVLLPEEEIFVHPGDIIGIQHSAGRGSFLQCHPQMDSPWRQSYISLMKESWWEGGIPGPPNPTWVDSMLCDLRVTFVQEMKSLAIPPMLAQRPESGTYSYTATVRNAVSSSQASCSVQVRSKVSDLQLIYPTPLSGKLNIPTKQEIFLVVKITSGCKAVANWMSPVDMAGVPFVAACPAGIVLHVPSCYRETTDTWFSSVKLVMDKPREEEILDILVSNEVSAQKLSVKIQSHDAIDGLRVVPPGPCRMLVDVSQVFTAEISQGSSVSYTWVIDNMDTFAYNGQSYSVTFKRPATYKLKLTAKNPVSFKSLELMLIAEPMNPLAHPELLGLPGIVEVNVPQTMIFRVEVDTAVDLMMRWDFGDGSPEAETTLAPPYDAQLPRPDPQRERVQVSARVTHAFIQPGDYTVRAEALNKYEQVHQMARVCAVVPITLVTILSSPTSPLAKEVTRFEALVSPSLYGIWYSWNFGDGSPVQEGPNSTVRYSFEKAGVYNVTLRVNNNLSDVTSWASVSVREGIMGLNIVCSGPSELGSVTVVNATVTSGTDVRWSFDMGDGSIYRNLSHGVVSHIFAAEGKYTITVTVHSAAAYTKASTIANIYKLRISTILAPSCLSSGELTLFQAFVTGPVKGIMFCWDFQDGRPPAVRHGDPTVLHSYMVAGNYQVNLTVYGTMSSASRQLAVCVEDKISSVKLLAPMSAVALEEPLSFLAEVDPGPDPQHQYRYHWDFGIGEDPVPSKTPEITFVYLEAGLYMVTVTVQNTVSQQNASLNVTAQQAINTISIHHSGETGIFLAVGTLYDFVAEVSWDTTAAFQWDFGDASPPQVGQRAPHTYKKAGDFTIMVVGENLVSHRTATLTMTVLTPVKLLTLHAEQPVSEAGQEVTFRSSLAAGDRVRYCWAVGETTGFQEGAAIFTHTFPTLGTFAVFAVAENPVSIETANVTVEVQERVQGVQIHSEHVVQDKYVAIAEAFSLSSEVAQGSNVTFRWAALKGKHPLFTSEGQLFLFCPNTSGELLVEVKAGNALGEVTTSLTLEVLERVHGVMVQSAFDNVAVGKPVNLNVSVVSGTDLLYQWKVQEDAQLLLTTTPSLSHIYNTLGSKLVFVTVYNALGSSNGSTELRVQEPVSGANFSMAGIMWPFVLKSGTSVELLGMVDAGSDLAWEWQLQRGEEEKLILSRGQNISHRFGQFGDYRVFLRVWNDVSESTSLGAISVQDPVAGLGVTVDKRTVCTDDEVTFTLRVLKGSRVTFAVYFPSLGIHMDNPAGIFHFPFPVKGYHQVLASAYNNVSNQTATAMVKVLEKVKGLHLLGDCPPILEANKELTFRAAVQAGENVAFSWAFRLPGLPDYNVTGQQVTYTPSGKDNLTILIEATNAFCADTLLVVRKLEVPVVTVDLSSNGTRTFVNQTVTFDVMAVGGSNLHMEWNFGDSPETFSSEGDQRVFHKYRQAGDFLVEVRVYNNISFVFAQLKVTVQLLLCESPTLKLVEPLSAISKSYTTYFEADVDLKQCTAYRALYRWEIFRSCSCDAPSKTNAVSLPHVDVLTPRLVLPKLSLDIGPHCLLFTISLENTPLAQMVCSNLTVLSSKLVPVIHGGSWRRGTAKMDLVLDGSKSYDPDEEEGGNSSLAYQWDCQLEAPNVSTTLCGFPAMVGMDRVIVPHSMLNPGATYHFNLTVKKSGKDPAWVIQKQVLIASSLEEILPVTLECHSCSALSSYEVSSSIHVTLSGQCESCDNGTLYIWRARSSDGQPLTLDNVTTSTGDSNRDLVIRQGVLQDGVNYTFTVLVTQPRGQLRGEAGITLTPNHPPRGGLCILRPEKNIYILETPVRFQCMGWMDEDSSPMQQQQLIYTLTAEMCSPHSSHCWHSCLYRGVKSAFSIFLPAGALGNQSSVNILVELEDSRGAKTLALNQTLTLTMPELPSGFNTITSWLKKKSQSELWGVVQQGNPQEVIPYSLALISLLNHDFGRGYSMKELRGRISIRSNVTAALASLNISSVKDVAQLSAALRACAAFPEELSLGSRTQLLEAAKRMIQVIHSETKEGHETPTSAGNSILAILGIMLTTEDTKLHMVANDRLSKEPALRNWVSSAFNLTRALMRSLMKSRVLNEETLSLSVSEIHVRGKRADASNLLCTSPSVECLFSVPRTLAEQLAESQEVVQVTMDLAINPFPFNYYTNSAISTRLALLEFTTPAGAPISVANLPKERAISLRLPAGQQKLQDLPQTLLVIPPGDSVNFTVKVTPGSNVTGTHVHIIFTVVEGFGFSQETVPSLYLYGHNAPSPNEFHYSLKEEIAFSNGLEETRSRDVTLLISSLHHLNETHQEYYINITSRFCCSAVRASVSVFASLCQYFHFPSMQWSADGVTPTAATSPKEIVCLTEHLTVFGGSLFVPLHSVVFLPPRKRSWQSPLALITCGILFSIYLGIALISHKLDDIDITRVGIIPRCGQPGRYKYWLMVKTGWKRGSGTTAHIGIRLYGLNKSGSRHLDKGWAFQRNSQDIFQVETDANLGEIWKIRIWHDNTGLDPSWYLQHVIVWDKQTDNMYFFLVEDWLSVENEKNEGMVEKEVLAACPQELRCFSRIFPAQMRLGFSDWHMWLSVWSRPPNSRFTRVQRLTCCMLMVQLFLATCAVWYGAVGVKGHSYPVGRQISVTAESIVVGIIAAVVVYPIQLLFGFLFRKTRSKIVIEDPDPPAQDCQTVEMDVSLDCSNLGSSSFLSVPGRMESVVDMGSVGSESLFSRKPVSNQKNFIGNNRTANQWPSCNSIFDIPDLLNSDPLMNGSRILKRKKAMAKLGIDSMSSSDDDPLSFSFRDSEDSRRSSCGHHSAEGLLNCVADRTQENISDCVTSDSGRFSPQVEADLIYDGMESSSSGWSDGIVQHGSSWGLLRKSFSYVSAMTNIGSAFFSDLELPPATVSSLSTRIGVPRRPQEWLFPAGMLPAIYIAIFLLLAGCFSTSILYGSSFLDHTALMWLVSSAFAFATSFIFLEPMKVLFGALHAALISKPVESEADGLVENPLVKQMPERVGKVRVPCGYGLLQAKEEAKKVRALKGLMWNCLTHMLFFLVVLTINYQRCFHDNNVHLLHAAVKQAISVTNDKGLNFTSVRSYSDTLEWIDTVLLKYLYGNTKLTIVGVPQLQLQSSTASQMRDLGLPRPGIASQIYHFSSASRPCPLCHLSGSRSEAPRDTNKNTCPDATEHTSIRFWIWGHAEFYHANDGCAKELGNTSAKAQRILHDLQASNWVHKRSKALLVEFTQYNADVNLYVTVMLLFEFPSDRPAIASMSIFPFPMLKSGDNMDLRLVMMICLLLFSGAFVLPKLSFTAPEKASCPWQSHSRFRLLLALISVTVAALHFTNNHLAKARLLHSQKHRQAFTSFYEVAVLARIEAILCALLLTITMLKMVQQLRFVRRWSVFGKTFQHALRELVAIKIIFLLFLLICAKCGCLVGYKKNRAFSSTVEEFRTLPRAFSALLSTLCGKITFLQSLMQISPILGTTYILSFGAGVLWMVQSFLCASVLNSYRTVHSEIYHPAIEPQDYEMIEFLVKRLKLWLGLSKTKEFRHKVKFEGMDSLVSHSSGNSKPSRLPSPGTNFHCPSATISSFSSEELVLPESPIPDPCNVDFYLEHLPSAVNDLLEGFDRVLKLMEDVCHLETSLEETQRRICKKKKKGQKSHPMEKVATLASRTSLGLPRTYSTFSESALARLRAHHVRISSCSATEGGKQHPDDTESQQSSAGYKVLVGNPPASGHIFRSTLPWPAHLFKKRPRSEEGQGYPCCDVLQRQIPLKRRAWQTEGTGDM